MLPETAKMSLNDLLNLHPKRSCQGYRTIELIVSSFILQKVLLLTITTAHSYHIQHLHSRPTVPITTGEKNVMFFVNACGVEVCVVISRATASWTGPYKT